MQLLLSHDQKREGVVPLCSRVLYNVKVYDIIIS